MDTVRPGFEKVTNTVQQNVTSNASTYAIIGGSVVGGIAVIYGISYYILGKVRGQSSEQRPVVNENPVTMYSPALVSSKYAVGYYNGSYPGWRQVEAKEWTNPTFQAALVQAHQEGGGWPLLEEPLLCNGSLYVVEGYVKIDGAYVVPKECYHSEVVSTVYSATNYDTEVSWTTTAPMPGNNWTVEYMKSSNYEQISKLNPICLFVKSPNKKESRLIFRSNPELNLVPITNTVPVSETGGKKTRRRKGSRKQKRGTRKH